MKKTVSEKLNAEKHWKFIEKGNSNHSCCTKRPVLIIKTKIKTENWEKLEKKLPKSD